MTKAMEKVFLRSEATHKESMASMMSSMSLAKAAETWATYYDII